MGWFPHIHTQFHVLGATPDTASCESVFGYGTFTLYRARFPSDLRLTYHSHIAVHTPIGLLLTVWALPLSLATTDGITFVFSSYGYLDVSVPHVSPAYPMYSDMRNRTFTPAEFPHSEIRALTPICGYTRLIAACHVLHRLLVPRHSPCALNSLNTVSILFDYLSVSNRLWLN